LYSIAHANQFAAALRALLLFVAKLPVALAAVFHKIILFFG